MNLTKIENPKVLIYGTGAIGSIFGGKIALSGIDITLLAMLNFIIMTHYS